MSGMTAPIKDLIKWSKEPTQAITRETTDRIPEEYQIHCKELRKVFPLQLEMSQRYVPELERAQVYFVIMFHKSTFTRLLI